MAIYLRNLSIYHIYNIPCSDVSDEDDIEGPVGELGGVEDSDTDSADGAFRSSPRV